MIEPVGNPNTFSFHPCGIRAVGVFFVLFSEQSPGAEKNPPKNPLSIKTLKKFVLNLS